MLATRNIGIRVMKPSFLFQRQSVLRPFQKRFNSTAKKLYEPSQQEAQMASKMSWEEFLALRKQQRRIGVIGSAAAALLTMGASFSYLSQIEIDPTETLFGLDVFTVKIMATYRTKQTLFLKHIAKMRVDASRQSMNNPVPDYYGEKIGSLAGYRQWLRDCNEYRRKAREFL
ncbi:hypothetical protein PMKS-002022 [Pichia membranifaciens]|uniref:Presequence translocated-associated motor subunit PAM17 n=1 Tax=Pichia membranifaciens TaxID=4926 RepID=A0A1Q2YGE1_9ASCO|nr:hypothetical protein PMKS-002022 [Pichia membranifaciens]